MNGSPERTTSRPLISFEHAVFKNDVDEALLEAAARRASDLGCTLQGVLQSHEILSSDRIVELLAGELGLELDPLDDDVPPLSSNLSEALKSGILLRRLPDGRDAVTIISRGLRIHDFVEASKKDPPLFRNLRLTSPERFNRYLRRIGATELAHEAALGLYRRRPDLSAAWRGKYNFGNVAFVAGTFALLAGWFFPQETLHASEIFLALIFLCWVVLRLGTLFMPGQPPPRLDLPERALPIYTIVVPLYREARIVEKLVGGLSRLNYPIEKLDIKFVCEADDTETLNAIQSLRLAPYHEVILAPRAGPRTKPKALMAALPFARGSFLVVYDAEDEPEPDQLRLAIARYRRGPRNLACVQAKLAIDNARDGWLTKNFAAEYAGLFDVFLPVMADLRLPLPLGGTSNHFRTEILRLVGGWDPFNVTEDADLGMRLARFGYASDIINSTTYEEAPNRHGAWLRQRTRWFKGWLQTWLVHMRSPVRLIRELGVGGFVAFQLLVGGTVFAALVHPFFLAIVIYDVVVGSLFAPSDDFGDAFRRGLAATTFLLGYFCSGALGLLGLKRRKLMDVAWWLLTIPFYWVFLSAAAWRGVFQLATDPHRWEKIEHGLAVSSRHDEGLGKGRIPHTAQKVKAAAANRRPPRRRYVSN